MELHFLGGEIQGKAAVEICSAKLDSVVGIKCNMSSVGIAS